MTEGVEFAVTTEPLPSHLERIVLVVASARRYFRDGQPHDVVHEAINKAAEKAKKITDCVGVYGIDAKFTESERMFSAVVIGIAARQAPDKPNDFGL